MTEVHTQRLRASFGRMDRAVRWALGLDVFSIVLFAIGIVLLQARGDEHIDRGFWSELPYAVLMLTAVGSAVAAGVVAAISLFRDRPTTKRGRWAFGLALVASLALPVLGLVEGVFRLFDHRLHAGWGEPVMPFVWLAVIASVGLGTFSHERGRRGLLMLPMILGAFVLTFVFGDIIFPTTGPTG